MNKYSQCPFIGFDLDGTLYKGSRQIDAQIQAYIFERIAEHKGTSLSDAEILFSDLYKNGNGVSGRQALQILEIPNAAEIIQEALENADIASVLTPDPTVLELLENLRKHDKELSIITGSNREQLDAKLHALAIPSSLFTHIITGEVAEKSSGDAYRLWLSQYPEYTASQFIYIGDRPKSDCEVPIQLGMNALLVNVTTHDPDASYPQLPDLSALTPLLI